MQKYTQFSYFQNFKGNFVLPKILWMPLELSASFPAYFSAVLSEKMTIKRAFKNDKIEKKRSIRNPFAKRKRSLKYHFRRQ